MNATQIAPDNPNSPSYRLALLVFLAAFVGIRIAGMLNNPLLEDHDSAGYLHQIGVFATFDGDHINNALTPDILPLYPLTGALLNSVGLPEESAARLTSFSASILTAALIVLVAVRLGSWPAGAIAAMLMAFEPMMARYSYAVLTEPMYTALVMLGIWLMVRGARAPPSVPGAIALGTIFGLAFLCRSEGILFLAGIPLLQWCLTLAASRQDIRRQLRPLAVWTAVFGTVFALLAAPQVWFVSDKMNQFAINGRQAWSIIESARTGQGDEEQLRGLDYSPAITNLDYLQSSPKDLAKLAHTGSRRSLAQLIATNLDTLQRRTFPQLLGLAVFAFAPLGLLFLLRTKQFSEAFILTWFLGMAVALPLMYNVVPSHLLVSTPPLFLLAAFGLLGAGRETAQLAETGRWRQWTVPALLLAVTAFTVVSNARPVFAMIARPDLINPTADPASDPARYARFLPILKAACAANPDEVVLVRKRYVTTLSRCTRLVMPYATFDQLRTYAAANKATLMFVESEFDAMRPFYRELVEARQPPAGFELLASQDYPDGRRQFLYRFHLQDAP